MLRLRSCLILSTSLAIVGCSIHPLPDDVTRDKTVEIVDKIRCEARDALVNQIVKVLMDETNLDSTQIATNRSLLQKIQDGATSPEFFCSITENQIARPTLDRIQKFAKSGVAYAFKFDIKENKVKSGKMGFSMPFTNGTFGLSIGAGADKTRNNVREFTIADTFSGLVLATDTAKNLRCENFDPPRAEARRHWVFPIAGRIGLSEIFDTYVLLEKSKALKDSLSDQLIFTTILDATTTPSVTLNGIPQKQFRIASASATYTAKRTDIHEVKLTLTRPSPTKTESFTEFPGAARIQGMPPGLSLGFVVKKNKTRPGPRFGQSTEGCRITQTVALPGQRGVTTRSTMNFTSPFLNTQEENEAARAKAAFESDRREFLDTTRQLRDLIGR